MVQPATDDHPNTGEHAECVVDHGGRGLARHCLCGGAWPCGARVPGSEARFPATIYHRYEPVAIGKCGRCGKDRWQVEHFNGDHNALALARDIQVARARERSQWVDALRVGQTVKVVDDHPTDAMQGLVGDVVAVHHRPYRQSVVTIRFPSRTVSVKSSWLEPVPLPEPPPRFANVEEADRWLEDTAKEMGIKTAREVPFFDSPEQAQEWLDRQGGEPYVPPSWSGEEAHPSLHERWLQLSPSASPKRPVQPLTWTSGDDVIDPYV